jgi:eukaryotic translation initiation factor 2C
MYYLFSCAIKVVSLCSPAYYIDLICKRARYYLADLFDTLLPSAALSVAGTSAASSAGTPSASDVQIHENLRDTMFYI